MNRKPFIKTAVILVLALLLPSCTQYKNNKAILDDSYLSDYSDFFVYQQEHIEFFDVDDDGILYILDRTYDGDISSKLNNTLTAFDLNGELINTYELFEDELYNALSDGESKPSLYPVNSLCVSNKTAYYIENSDQINVLRALSFETGKISVIAELPQGFEAFDMELIGEEMFIIGNDEQSMKKTAPLLDITSLTRYEGEMIYRVNVSSGDATPLDIEFPIAISSTLNNTLIIYAMDYDGYYFTEYTPEKNSLGNKSYNDLKKINCFSIINKDNDFVFSSPSTSLLRLAVGSLSSEEGIAEIMPNTLVMGKNGIVYKGGFTFFKNSYINSENSGKIERIKNTAYIKDVRKINMAAVGYIPDDPFGCGYTINRLSPSADEFALKVLSSDNLYDIYLMDSFQSFSLSIKNKGSFYSLNDIKGVSEYIDTCFPYIKDIATTDNGEIWMLPIGIDIPVILYNEENCLSNDIDIMNISNDDLAEASGRVFTDYKVSQYMSKYTTFDTAEFRELAEFAKDAASKYSLDTYFKNIDNLYFPDEFDKNVFTILDKRFMQQNFTPYSNIRARAFPKEFSDKNIATLTFLCLNPSSKNLDAAVDYISNLSRYLYKARDSMMFNDMSLYTDTDYTRDLYEIYESGDILFRLPDDVFDDDFYSYINEGEDIDFVISEIDRKKDTFLNE